MVGWRHGLSFVHFLALRLGNNETHPTVLGNVSVFLTIFVDQICRIGIEINEFTTPNKTIHPVLSVLAFILHISKQISKRIFFLGSLKVFWCAEILIVSASTVAAGSAEFPRIYTWEFDRGMDAAL